MRPSTEEKIAVIEVKGIGSAIGATEAPIRLYSRE
jgi:hypothetical protein